MPLLGYRALLMRQGVRNVVLQVVRFVMLLGMRFAGASVSRREAASPGDWEFLRVTGAEHERRRPSVAVECQGWCISMRMRFTDQEKAVDTGKGAEPSPGSPPRLPRTGCRFVLGEVPYRYANCCAGGERSCRREPLRRIRTAMRQRCIGQIACACVDCGGVTGAMPGKCGAELRPGDAMRCVRWVGRRDSACWRCASAAGWAQGFRGDWANPVWGGENGVAGGWRCCGGGFGCAAVEKWGGFWERA